MPGDYLNPFNTASDKHGNLYVSDYSHGYAKEVLERPVERVIGPQR